MQSTQRIKAGLFALVITLGMMQLGAFGQTSPAAGSTGTPSSPPSGNYPGTGSSPQPGVVPPSMAPSGPTPGSGQGGTNSTPPSGVTPGSGTSPNPMH